MGRVAPGLPRRDTMGAEMGFNPFREQRTNAFDVALVVVAIAVTTALIIWAIVG